MGGHYAALWETGKNRKTEQWQVCCLLLTTEPIFSFPWTLQDPRSSDSGTLVALQGLRFFDFRLEIVSGWLWTQDSIPTLDTPALQSAMSHHGFHCLHNHRIQCPYKLFLSSFNLLSMFYLSSILRNLTSIIHPQDCPCSYTICSLKNLTDEMTLLSLMVIIAQALFARKCLV